MQCSVSGRTDHECFRPGGTQLTFGKAGRIEPVGIAEISIGEVGVGKIDTSNAGLAEGRTAEIAAFERRLAEEGYRVLRFWNNDVLGNLEGVLTTIQAELLG